SPQQRDLAPLPSQLMLGFGTEPGLVRREFRHLGSCGIVISAERLRRQRGRMHRTVPALFSHPLYLSSACSHSIDSHDLGARYRSAGLNIFGKSASPEMGLAPSTEPAMCGPCRNPWNLAHSA